MDNRKVDSAVDADSTAQSRMTYWSAYYGAKTVDHRMQAPSQFAAFIASEIAPDFTVFDIGCGSGRDSVFFAELGFDVVALDGCGDAISVAQITARARGLQNITFLTNTVTGVALEQALQNSDGQRRCVYARFFLHAITESEQRCLFVKLSEALSAGDIIAFEYRTSKDKALQKVAPPHFRRYQDANAVNDALKSHGFKLLYDVEGQGFAKYKNEDAFVARCLFERH